eukprot:1162099-Pelagomonas_calceolata.AAC.4
MHSCDESGVISQATLCQGRASCKVRNVLNLCLEDKMINRKAAIAAGDQRSGGGASKEKWKQVNEIQVSSNPYLAQF